jgi:nucleotide-binding universal stress UspA family protein
MKPKHVLLTTDLSEDAWRALAPVADLASSTGARVTILHVVYMLRGTSLGAEVGEPIGLPDYERDRASALTVLDERVAGLPAGLDITTRVTVGTNVAESIVRTAKDIGADLIALSTHGRTGFRRLVVGSVAEEVLRRAHVPVLCFPLRDAKLVDQPLKLAHVLLTTDLSDEALRAFPPALELAAALDCRVSVLHVAPELLAALPDAPLVPPITLPDTKAEIESARHSLEEQCATIEASGKLATHVTSHVDPAQGIVEFAAEHDVDLIALSTHGRTGFRRLAVGSVAEDVLRASSVPVLSFHQTKD